MTIDTNLWGQILRRATDLLVVELLTISVSNETIAVASPENIVAAFVKVGSEVHEADFGEAEIG